MHESLGFHGTRIIEIREKLEEFITGYSGNGKGFCG